MTQGCLIRIVEDDEDMRESLSFLLESEGWNCAAYASVREFLIEDAASIPGCLILDIRMPEMTGLELQQEMNRRKNFPADYLPHRTRKYRYGGFRHEIRCSGVSSETGGSRKALKCCARLCQTLQQWFCGFGLRHY